MHCERGRYRDKGTSERPRGEAERLFRTVGSAAGRQSPRGAGRTRAWSCWPPPAAREKVRESQLRACPSVRGEEEGTHCKVCLVGLLRSLHRGRVRRPHAVQAVDREPGEARDGDPASVHTCVECQRRPRCSSWLLQRRPSDRARRWREGEVVDRGGGRGRGCLVVRSRGRPGPSRARLLVAVRACASTARRVPGRRGDLEMKRRGGGGGGGEGRRGKGRTCGRCLRYREMRVQPLCVALAVLERGVERRGRVGREAGKVDPGLASSSHHDRRASGHTLAPGSYSTQLAMATNPPRTSTSSRCAHPSSRLLVISASPSDPLHPPCRNRDDVLQFLDSLDTYSNAPAPAKPPPSSSSTLPRSTSNHSALGSSTSGPRPSAAAPPAQGSSTAGANAKEAQSVLDFLDEITQRSSTPTTAPPPRPLDKKPSVPSSLGRSTSRNNLSGTAAGAAAAAGGAAAPPRRSTDSARSVRSVGTAAGGASASPRSAAARTPAPASAPAPAPAAAPASAHSQPDRQQQQQAEAPAEQAQAAAGGWGWSSMWSQATTVVQQASHLAQQARTAAEEQVKTAAAGAGAAGGIAGLGEGLIKKLGENEQVKKYSEGVMSYAKGAHLDQLGASLRPPPLLPRSSPDASTRARRQRPQVDDAALAHRPPQRRRAADRRARGDPGQPQPRHGRVRRRRGARLPRPRKGASLYLFADGFLLRSC